MLRWRANLILLLTMALTSAARGADVALVPPIAPLDPAPSGSASLVGSVLPGAVGSGSLIPTWEPAVPAPRALRVANWGAPEEIQPAPPASNPVPPPDPAPPRWGNYGLPVDVPSRLPPTDYTLIGAPRRWIQPDVPPEFRAAVADPAAVPDYDLQFTQPINLNRADGLAPPGVSRAVTLPTGRLMITYGYQQTNYEDLFAGIHHVSNASAGAVYTNIPIRGLSDSQIVNVTFGATEDVTITGSLPYIHNQIDYTTLGGVDTHTSFTEPGDIKLSALYVIRRAEREQWHVNLGLSVPVGLLESLNPTGSPNMLNIKSYPLRTSSGTYDLLPGYTYRGQSDHWSWGLQANGVVRLGFNTLGYKLGDVANVTAWFSRLWTQQVSTSLRLDSNIWGNIGGQDSRLNPALAPTNSTTAQGGRRIDVLLGVNYYLPQTRIPGQYLTLEAGVPCYQSLDGPQLGVDWLLNASWNMIW